MQLVRLHSPEPKKPKDENFFSLLVLDVNVLNDYDDNDGKIDEKDNVYNALKVWQDANQDGQTDVGELKTFSELNISSINLEEEKILNYFLEGHDIKPVNNLLFNVYLLVIA